MKIRGHGTRGSVLPSRFIRKYAAAQFEWQSSSAPMIPPFKIPGNA